MKHSQEQIIYYQERIQKLRDFLRRTGFTGNVPFSLNFMSLPLDERTKFVDEARAAFNHVENLSPYALLELFEILDIEYDDTSDDDDDDYEDDDETIEAVGG